MKVTGSRTQHLHEDTGLSGQHNGNGSKRFDSAEEARKFIIKVVLRDDSLRERINADVNAEKIGCLVLDDSLDFALRIAGTLRVPLEVLRPVLIKRIGDLVSRGEVDAAYSATLAFNMRTDDVLEEITGRIESLAHAASLGTIHRVRSRFELTDSEVMSGVILGMGRLIRDAHVRTALSVENEFSVGRAASRNEVARSIKYLISIGNDKIAGLAAWEFGFKKAELVDLYSDRRL